MILVIQNTLSFVFWHNHRRVGVSTAVLGPLKGLDRGGRINNVLLSIVRSDSNSQFLFFIPKQNSPIGEEVCAMFFKCLEMDVMER